VQLHLSIPRLTVTGTKTYKEAVTSALGDKAGRALATATTVKTFVACLMYSIIIGDTVHALAGTAGISGVARWRLLTAVTATVLTPLCLLRSFAVLGFTSLLGIAGTLYTVVFMGIRCFDGTYRSKIIYVHEQQAIIQCFFNVAGESGTYAPGGVFHEALAAAPSAGKALLPAFGDAFSGSKMFVLVSMLSTAFIAHYNAPR